jgi:hypothetical protein
MLSPARGKRGTGEKPLAIEGWGRSKGPLQQPKITRNFYKFYNHYPFWKGKRLRFLRFFFS